MTNVDRIPADPWVPDGWEPDPEPGSLLDHIRAVWPAGADRAATSVLAASLATFSTAYAGLATADLTRKLKAAGVVPRTLKIDGKSARGVRLADVRDAPGSPETAPEPVPIVTATPEPSEPPQPEPWTFYVSDGRHVRIGATTLPADELLDGLQPHTPRPLSLVATDHADVTVTHALLASARIRPEHEWFSLTRAVRRHLQALGPGPERLPWWLLILVAWLSVVVGVVAGAWLW